MLGRRKLILLFLVAAGATMSMSDVASAAYRQRYSSWSYHPKRSYYYRQYYYKPHTSYSGYQYHYCIHYPTRPRYVYYYNPVRRVYWGRYDLETQGYSMLAEKDRKEKLEDIADDAFPKPSEMPSIPESEDGVKMDKIAEDDLPNSEVPKDAPSDL